MREAFQGDHVGSLLEAMRDDHSWLDLSFVAVLDDEAATVAGHVAFTRGWVDAPDRLEQVLILSPLSVRPALQGRGVGAALIERSFQLLSERTEPLVFLEGDPRYYRRHGFVPAEPLGFLRPSLRIPPPAFQVRRPRDHGPSVTGAVVYPDVFWRHDAVGLRE